MIDVVALMSLITIAAEQLPSQQTTDAITGIGGTSVAVFVAYQFARLVNAVTKFLGKLEDHLEDEAKAWKRAADHYDVEERHHRRVEELLARPQPGRRVRVDPTPRALELDRLRPADADT